MKPQFFGDRVKVEQPGELNKAVYWWVLRPFRPLLYFFFRPQILNIDRLPTDRPFLLVSNHSISLSELPCFALKYIDLCGFDRKLAGFAHPFAFFLPPMSLLVPKLGAIPSTYTHAFDTLEKGVPILIFPGGDHESIRPFWQNNVVDFNQRKGFLKIARKARVPIVPMGIHGSHATCPILWRSEFVLPWLLVLPKLFGINRFPLSLLGLLGAIAIVYSCWTAVGFWTLGLVWLWFASLLHFWPIIPRKVTYRIGKVVEHEQLFSADDDDLQTPYDYVTNKIQELVNDNET